MHRIDRLTTLIAATSLGAVLACGGGQTTTAPPAAPAPAQPDQPPPPAPPPAPAPVAEVAKEPPPPELVFPSEDFRKQQPGAAETRPFRLPKIQQLTLPNGIRAYLVEQHKLPTISVSLVLPGGSINDPKGKEGLADVCMDLMTDGTRDLDKIALSEALADTASRITSFASSDEQGMTMTTLSQHFDATFKLFRDSLLAPGFRQDELDRKVKRLLSSLRQARASARSISRRVSSKITWGDKHPLGRVTTEASLKALTVNDCVKYHASYVKPGGAKLFIVGDMTSAQVRAKFGGGLRGWRGRPKRSAQITRPQPMAGRVFFINVPGSAQSSVSVLNTGPSRKAADYFPTAMAAAVLGGSFSARVNMNLREDKGYSYGARAGFRYDRRYGRFYAAAAVRSDSTYQSVIELVNEVAGMHSGTRPATKAELDRERNGSVLGLPGYFATAGAALRQYRNLVYYGLPLRYYESYARQLQRVTLAQVQRAARRHFNLKNAKFLVVGDADPRRKDPDGATDKPLLDPAGKPMTLLDGLRKLLASGQLGPGKLVILDADGNVAPPATAGSQ